MLGAIAGDVIGSVYEFASFKSTDFPLFQMKSRFTDDTVLTVALADCLVNDRPYLECMIEYVNRYPGRGYGSRFKAWIHGGTHTPYYSFGNGAAMRISPVGYAADTMERTRILARHFTAVTHDHPEGLKGGEAIAAAVFMARHRASKSEIKEYIINEFGYDLDRTIDSIRPEYQFDETCQGSVPEAIIAFLEGDSFENTVRLAVSLGGDADTLACIAGSIAEPFYGGVPLEIVGPTLACLDDDLRSVVTAFRKKYTL